MRPRFHWWAAVTLVLVALAIAACGGGDDDDGAAISNVEEVDAVEAIVEFAVAVELTDLVILEIFSGGYQHRLLAPEVEVDTALFLKLVDRWDRLAPLEEPTLAAIDRLDDRSVRDGGFEPLRYAALAPGGAGEPREDPAAVGPFDAVKEAATAFFGW